MIATAVSSTETAIGSSANGAAGLVAALPVAFVLAALPAVDALLADLAFALVDLAADFLGLTTPSITFFLGLLGAIKISSLTNLCLIIARI